MSAHGLDAFGVDPNAPADRRLTPQRVEQAAAGLGQFDAVTAVMALHHADLEAVVEALGQLVRLGGRLFVCEVVWDAYDDRAAAWLAEHDASGADNSLDGWWREHTELHTASTVHQALASRFAPVVQARRPYLARMLRRPDLEVNEHAMIDAELLPALGVLQIAQRIR